MGYIVILLLIISAQDLASSLGLVLLKHRYMFQELCVVELMLITLKRFYSLLM